MTERLRLIRERCERATEGMGAKWTHQVVEDENRIAYDDGEDADGFGVALVTLSDDAAFIAAAREDVPWLLAQLAASEQLRRCTDHYCDNCLAAKIALEDSDDAG